MTSSSKNNILQIWCCLAPQLLSEFLKEKRNTIHTIGVKLVDMIRHGARFAVLDQTPVSDCSS